MGSRTRDLYSVILLAVLANSALWLDSLDRYLNSRYHLYLSQYLPDEVFLPSRVMREAMLPEQEDEQEQTVPISIVPLAHATKAAPPDAIAPVSGALTAMPQASGVQADATVALSQMALSTSVPPAAAEKTDAAPAEPAPQPPKAVALRVLFAGDSMMQGVAPLVISRMRKEYPDGVFVDLSKPSTGLVARRYFDWPAKVREESLKQNIQVIVMFLGPNDPWDIYDGKRRYAFPSDAWEEKYRGRVDEVLEFARANGIRVIWIGLPSMREERVKQGAKIENRIFREEVLKYEFDFLPTEDFLGSLDDPYTKYVEDPKKGKQVVRLDDGVHFTKLGLRMISSRVNDLLRSSR